MRWPHDKASRFSQFLPLETPVCFQPGAHSQPSSKTQFKRIIPRMGSAPLPFGIDRPLLRLDGQDPYFCLHFVMIFVRDQERSLRFYVDQLRFRLVVDERFASGGRWIEVAPPDGS